MKCLINREVEFSRFVIGIWIRRIHPVAFSMLKKFLNELSHRAI